MAARRILAAAVLRLRELPVPVEPVPAWPPTAVTDAPSLRSRLQAARRAALHALAAAVLRARELPVPAEPVPAWPPSTRRARPVAARVADFDAPAADVEASVAAVARPADAPLRAAPRASGRRRAQPRAAAIPAIPVAPDPSTPLALIVAAQAAVQNAAEADKRWMSEPAETVAVERARSTSAQRIGDDGERLAALRLASLGWEVLARNLRVGRTEVDLLAIDPSDPPSLVVVEVRRRTRRDFGLAEETLDYRKRLALLRAAGDVARRPVLPDGRRLPDLPVRVDLIAIDQGPDGRPSVRHHRGIDL